MRYACTLLLTVMPLVAQYPPDCRGVRRDVDVRCACEKDSASKQCAMVRAGFYDPVDLRKVNSQNLISAWTESPLVRRSPAQTPVQPQIQRAQPQRARVVSLVHKDYLRFLQPNAQLVVGMDFRKVFEMAPLFGTMLEQEDGRTTARALAALKETDQMWLSAVNERDILLLMTGRFESGAAAGLFYSQGVRPVFLGGPEAMLIGAEPSIRGALARLATPDASPNWVVRRVRELARDHEACIVGASPATLRMSPSPLSGIQQFALGARLAGEQGIDGEVLAESPESVERILQWVDRMKEALKARTEGALDALKVEKAGTTVRFALKDMPSGGPRTTGNPVLESEFGAELYALILAGMPGQPKRAIAGDRMRAVKKGMNSDEVVALVGPPLSVMAIQGLEEPRQNWIYQVAFGKRVTLRLDGGVVTVEPRP